MPEVAQLVARARVQIDQLERRGEEHVSAGTGAKRIGRWTTRWRRRWRGEIGRAEGRAYPADDALLLVRQVAHVREV